MCYFELHKHVLFFYQHNQARRRSTSESKFLKEHPVESGDCISSRQIARVAVTDDLERGNSGDIIHLFI